MQEQTIGSYQCTYVHKELDDCADYACFSVLQYSDTGINYKSGTHFKRLNDMYEIVIFESMDSLDSDTCEQDDDGDFVLMRMFTYDNVSAALYAFSREMEKLDPSDFIKVDHFLHSSMLNTAREVSNLTM